MIRCTYNMNRQGYTFEMNGDWFFLPVNAVQGVEDKMDAIFNSGVKRNVGLKVGDVSQNPKVMIPWQVQVIYAPNQATIDFIVGHGLIPGWFELTDEMLDAIQALVTLTPIPDPTKEPEDDSDTSEG